MASLACVRRHPTLDIPHRRIEIMTTLYETCIPSPIGKLTLVADDKTLVRVQFAASKKRDTNKVLEKATRELEEYFAGKRTRFTLPLAFSGTKLQEKVWRALAEI